MVRFSFSGSFVPFFPSSLPPLPSTFLFSFRCSFLPSFSPSLYHPLMHRRTHGHLTHTHTHTHTHTVGWPANTHQQRWSSIRVIWCDMHRVNMTPRSTQQADTRTARSHWTCHVAGRSATFIWHHHHQSLTTPSHPPRPLSPSLWETLLQMSWCGGVGFVALVPRCCNDKSAQSPFSS